MGSQGYSQLELFSQTKGNNKDKIHNGNSFFKFICNYEKILLIIIGFIITGVVSFCIGVEKGKKIVVNNSLNSHLEIVNSPRPENTTTNPQTNEKDTTFKEQKQPITEEQSTVTQEKKPKYTQQKFTIQVASYQSKNQAQKEAEILKKRGFPSLVIAKNKFNIVCIGNFASKDKARTLLTELKKQYRDSYIRRL